MSPVFLSSSASDPVIWRGWFSSLPQAMARSPQSTLCAWSTSNKGSPNGPSLVSSPPSSSPLAQRSKDDPCDLLCEAADQVMLLRRLGDLGRHRTVYDRGVLGPPRLPLPATFAISRNIDDGYDASTPVFTLEQLQAARVSLILFHSIVPNRPPPGSCLLCSYGLWPPLLLCQFYHLKRQQTMNQQLSAAWGRQSKARCCGGRDGEGRCGWPLDLSPSAWPPLREPQLPKQRPPQPVAGMRTVFLDGSHARKEPIGTGVFLPRSACNVLDPRKTTGKALRHNDLLGPRILVPLFCRIPPLSLVTNSASHLLSLAHSVVTPSILLASSPNIIFAVS